LEEYDNLKDAKYNSNVFGLFEDEIKITQDYILQHVIFVKKMSLL